MHPHKTEASETSRSKMRAITGRGGGGTGFVGGSPFKRAGADGEQKSYLGHEKVWASPKAAGGAVKRRADKFARGGKVKKANGGPTSDYESSPSVGEASSGAGQGSWPSGRRPFGETGESEPPSGRVKRAAGGRTMMPYGPERRSTSRAKPGKKGGNVNIAINMPPHIPHPGGGLPPPMPPGGPPGGAGGPPGGMPPGGGAPPPAIPPALMGGAMPGGAPGGPGGAPGGPGGGMNPAALQALAGIAGQGGGPMGAGAPGRGPFAKGGAVRSTGLTSNMKHWQDYSTRNVKGNSAQNRGATGESEELPLRMPDHVGGASDAEVAKKRGGRGEGGKYAAGGRTKAPISPFKGGKYDPPDSPQDMHGRYLPTDERGWPEGTESWGEPAPKKRGGRAKHASGGKIPVPMTGGSETGVGRKRMAKLQPRYR